MSKKSATTWNKIKWVEKKRDNMQHKFQGNDNTGWLKPSKSNIYNWVRSHQVICNQEWKIVLHMQNYFSLLITNDLVWPHSVVDIAFAWFQSTSIVISLKLMLHVISFFFNPFDFISSCCRFLWQSLRKLKHQLSPSNWLKVFRTLKLYNNFHVMTFFLQKTTCNFYLRVFAN